ncbi:hypothetical protein CERZMDRAFT_95538 [Cercospora zeae-maydis SCOH1-5]|uniref:Uncharacterized protein n=1 Tax=Cercospora zeae-maydis SCOH1-5 TaxID=717836 RepID=A0A6A6FLE5_9PEZI|nr:hypothetical protein CERZMDRAFT_95538 [Cercospora zeae-maydis SCOH1-5]
MDPIPYDISDKENTTPGKPQSTNNSTPSRLSADIFTTNSPSFRYQVADPIMVPSSPSGIQSRRRADLEVSAPTRDCSAQYPRGDAFTTLLPVSNGQALGLYPRIRSIEKRIAETNARTGGWRIFTSRKPHIIYHTRTSLSRCQTLRSTRGPHTHDPS